VWTISLLVTDVFMALLIAVFALWRIHFMYQTASQTAKSVGELSSIAWANSTVSAEEKTGG
jgi:hypothetical protein